MGRKDTISLIARTANVSIATVSRVASGNTKVNPEIQRRVREVAEKLGISLSKTKKSRSVAFLLSNRNMLHPFHARILYGAEAYCSESGLNLVYCSFRYPLKSPWKELALPRPIQHGDLVQGAILAGNNSQAFLHLLRHRGIRFVVLGNNVLEDWQRTEFDVVWSDDIQGAHEMTLYLQSLGHREIWFVGNSRLPWFARCKTGYKRAMEEAGLFPHQCEFDSGDQKEIGYLATKWILTQGNQVTAILAGTDECAQGVYRALRDSGRRIPEDVSVAGFNDTYASALHPRLATVREFPEQLGKCMAELLLNRITQPDIPPQQITIPTELVKGESCRPLRPAEDPVRADENRAYLPQTVSEGL